MSCSIKKKKKKRLKKEGDIWSRPLMTNKLLVQDGGLNIYINLFTPQSEIKMLKYWTLKVIIGLKKKNEKKMLDQRAQWISKI